MTQVFYSPLATPQPVQNGGGPGWFKGHCRQILSFYEYKFMIGKINVHDRTKKYMTGKNKYMTSKKKYITGENNYKEGKENL